MLNALLSGTFIDPHTGKAISLPVQAVEIASSLHEDADARLDAVLPGAKLALVSDENTRTALGGRLAQALGYRLEADLTLSPEPKPDDQTVKKLADATELSDALVAVGSGTINDLCKYTAARTGKPYVVFATAPSMNGYLSANAAITVRGHRKSLAAQMPLAAFFDLDVLCNAPLRLIRSGLGDAICRPTAQADWLLSHLLLGTDYSEIPFKLLQEDEAPLLADAAGLVRGDRAVMERLIRTLILSGIGMTLAGGSYPASQGEHLIAHSLGMALGHRLPETYHGEQIAVTTLTMAERQHQLIAQQTVPDILPLSIPESELAAFYGKQVAEECRPEMEKKAAQVRNIVQDSSQWNDVREKLAVVMRPVEELRAALEAIDAPTQPEHLGCTADDYAQAVRYAPCIRDRFTALDIKLD